MLALGVICPRTAPAVLGNSHGRDSEGLLRLSEWREVRCWRGGLKLDETDGDEPEEPHACGTYEFGVVVRHQLSFTVPARWLIQMSGPNVALLLV